MKKKILSKESDNKENNREVFVEITDKAKNDLALCAKKHDDSLDASQQILNIGLSALEEEQLLELLTKLTQ